MSRCAIGLSVHTGWAICVVASGSLRAPRVHARDRLQLLPDRERFVFHRAAEMDPAEAKRSVGRAADRAFATAAAAIAQLAGRARAAADDLVACAIAARQTPMRQSLEEILAAHARIHAAEGCFYRDVLRRAAEAHGVPVRIVAPDALGLDGAAALLAEAGRAAGRPWAKDQKLAALAAWTVL
ncbi:MAG TPA: hypothetical protein VFL36_19830 [Myxococcales bacterium]|nr:hypothetical protein [Myxococcales bacterium]